MKLREELMRQVMLPCIFFVIFLFVATALFIHLNTSLHSVLDETAPVTAALDHMVVDIYQDNSMLLDYLATTHYQDAIALDDQLEDLDEVCTIFENEVEMTIASGALSDETIIARYYEVELLHDEVEELRDEIISLHKQELATSQKDSEQKFALLSEHTDAMDQAITKASSIAEFFRIQSQNAQTQMLLNVKRYALIVSFVLLLFITLTVFQIRRLGKRIISPLLMTSTITNEFVNGKYESTLAEQSSIDEISDLQENINKVFALIDSASREDAKRKKEIDVQLLKKEYLQILEYIGSQQDAGRKVNMTELRKALDVTHPTIHERVQYLRKRGLLALEKEGREKFLYLVE